MAPTHIVILILLYNFIPCRGKLSPHIKWKIGVQPSLTTATFTTKDIQLLDVELGVSVYNFEFDQDLYLPSISTCTGFDCANFVPSECFCDYTLTNCGVSYGAGNSLPLEKLTFRHLQLFNEHLWYVSLHVDRLVNEWNQNRWNGRS